MLASVDQRKGKAEYRIDVDAEGRPTRIQLVTTCPLRHLGSTEEFRSEMTYRLSGYGSVTSMDIPADAARCLK